MNDTLARIEDEAEITRILYEYCVGIDSGRFDDTARLFAHGTWFLDPDTPRTGFEAVSAFLHDDVICYGDTPKTRHTMSNIRIDVADDRRTARCRSYLVVFQAIPGRPPHIMFQGAYDDTFHRVDGTWFFDERRIEADGTGDMSLHLRSAQRVGDLDI